MKLVSIIVPIYNVEAFLERCICSIQNQDYNEIEIILIDDGSPDKSGRIADEYAEKDKRIVVVHKNNEGVSAARNTGLDVSTGDYIVFVDGDDYLDSKYVSSFVSLLEKTDADMGLSYAFLRDDELPKMDLKPFRIINSSTACEELYLNKIGVAVWNKIYRRDFLEQNLIRFKNEYWFAEGMTFNINCFVRCNRIAVCSHKIYHYRTNANSAVRKFNIESWYCGLRAMEYQRKMIRNKNQNVINAWWYHKRQYNYSILCGIIKSGNENIFKAEIKKCKTGLRKNMKYPFIVNIPFKSKIKAFAVIIAPMSMAKSDAKKALRKEKSISDTTTERYNNVSYKSNKLDQSR